MAKLEYNKGEMQDMINDFISEYERRFGEENGHLIALYFLEPGKNGQVFGKLSISPLALKKLGKKGIITAMDFLNKDALSAKELIKYNGAIQ